MTRTRTNLQVRLSLLNCSSLACLLYLQMQPNHCRSLCDPWWSQKLSENRLDPSATQSINYVSSVTRIRVTQCPIILKSGGNCGQKADEAIDESRGIRRMCGMKDVASIAGKGLREKKENCLRPTNFTDG